MKIRIAVLALRESTDVYAAFGCKRKLCQWKVRGGLPRQALLPRAGRRFRALHFSERYDKGGFAIIPPEFSPAVLGSEKVEIQD